LSNDHSARIVCATVLLATFLPFPSSHAAQSYLGLGGGITYAPKTDIPELGALIDYDVGFRVGTVVLGRRFENGWRADLEASYRRNELEIVRFEDKKALNTGRHDSVQALSFMANGTYEFDLRLPVTPYIGAGLGLAGVFYDISDHDSPETILNDEAAALAYQVYAGLMIPLGQRWQIAADYRWWQTIDFDMTLESGEPISLDYSSRLFNLSFRRLLNGNRNEPAAEPLPVETDRWYVDTRLGTAFAADSDITNRVDTNFDAFDLGLAATVALGYSHVRPSGRRLRAELEVQGWENEADIIDFGPTLGEFSLGGSVKVRGAAVNVTYDFAPGWKIRPYAGLGIGYSEIDYDVTLLGDGDAVQYVDDAYSGIAFQALLGFGIRLTRQTELSLGYRYWLAPSVDLTDPAGDSLETEHGAHLLMLGLRLGLGD
jgi:opacity protein-like surface antigen